MILQHIKASTRRIPVLLLAGLVFIFVGVGYGLMPTQAITLPSDAATASQRLVVFESWLSVGCPYCQAGSV